MFEENMFRNCCYVVVVTLCKNVQFKVFHNVLSIHYNIIGKMYEDNVAHEHFLNILKT